MKWQDIFEFIAENGLGAIEKVTQNWQAKTVLGTIGALLVSAYDFINTPLLIFIGLVLVDFLSKMVALGHIGMKENNIGGNHLEALWYGYHNNKASQSFKMRTKGVNKIVQYVFVLIAVSLLGKLIPPTFSDYSTFVFDWILFYLSVGEVKSIFENLQEAGMKEAAFFIGFFNTKKKQMEDKLTGKNN